MLRPPAALLTCVLLLAAALPARAAAPFGVQVVDDQTGRGVPMVRLRTTSNQSYYTDSGGYAAIDDAALMNQKVFFTVTSFGYEFPADMFGSRGSALEVKPGGSATLKIKRINIAERLYRTTGEGIYRDTVLLGKKPPIAQGTRNMVNWSPVNSWTRKVPVTDAMGRQTPSTPDTVPR